MKRILFALPLLAIGVSSGHPSHAGQWVYTKIADSLTPNPVLGGLFNQFGEAPTWNGDRVVFSSSGYLYEYDPGNGSIAYLTGFNTPIPGGDGVFQGGFGGALADAGKLIFGGGGLNGQKGFYGLDSHGSLERIVDLNSPIPEGLGTFTNFSGLGTGTYPAPPFDAAGGRIVFNGSGTGSQRGIYLYDQGTLERVVDTATPIPGGAGTFADFGRPVLHGTSVMFAGYDSAYDQGLYIADETGVHLIASGADLAPGYSFPRLLHGFPYYGWQGEVPTFVGGIGNIYQFVNDSLIPQFGPSDSLPGLAVPGQFKTILGLAVDASGFAVAGNALDYDTGIWLSQNGVLEKVIGPGDVLDGFTIFGADDEVPDPAPDPFVGAVIGPQALNGRSVVFHATFAGSNIYKQGIYIATYVPEPSTWLLAALGCLGIALIRRVRGKLLGGNRTPSTYWAGESLTGRKSRPSPIFCSNWTSGSTRSKLSTATPCRRCAHTLPRSSHASRRSGPRIRHAAYALVR